MIKNFLSGGLRTTHIGSGELSPAAHEKAESMAKEFLGDKADYVISGTNSQRKLYEILAKDFISEMEDQSFLDIAIYYEDY